jgi:protein-tyrosine phosphatase
MDTKEKNTPNNSKCLTISKINNFIYLGSSDHPVNNSKEFQDLNIDFVINCAKEIVYPPDTKCHVDYFPIIDGDSISLLENMDHIETKIHTYLAKGKKIYIHCAKGVSRSPAVLIYYLMVHKNLSYDSAHELIKNARPIVDIDIEFENSLRAIED